MRDWIGAGKTVSAKDATGLQMQLLRDSKSMDSGGNVCMSKNSRSMNALGNSHNVRGVFLHQIRAIF